MALLYDERESLISKKEVTEDYGGGRNQIYPRIRMCIRISILLFIATFSLIYFKTRGSSSASSGSSDDDRESDMCIKTYEPVLAGYDVVAYFNMAADGTAILGSSDHQYQFNNYTFYFQNQHNLNLFANDPSSYAPQYGGFCAYGISSEYEWSWTAIQKSGPEADPKVWIIHENKLYIFMYEVPKRMFLTGDVNQRISSGVSRWNSYTSDEPLNYFNTQCMWWDLDCGHDGNYCIKEWETQHNDTTYDDDTRADADDYI